MDNFECKFVYTNTLYQQHCQLYYRYIDDIVMLWTGSEENLLTFVTHLNSRVSTLHFTLTYDAETANFLDVTIKKEGTRLQTDLYKKETERNNLLHFSSFHSPSLKNNLPKSQFMRVRRIVSEQQKEGQRLDEMQKRLEVRGYPKKLLETVRNEVDEIPREELRTKRVKQETSRLAFVSQYTTASNKVKSIINKHWHLLQTYAPHIKTFSEPPLMAYKRGKFFRDTLIKADVGSLIKSGQRFLGVPKMGTFPCLNCASCNNITKGSQFTHPQTGRKIDIKRYFTCNSTFVVYLIKCPCGLAYVGETTQKVKDRIKQHKSNVRCGYTHLPIPAHFAAARHTVSQLQYQVIDSVEPLRRGGDRILQLKKLEMKWIQKLGTLDPGGLNREYTPMLFI
ncbi:uncharacterized protein LOC121396834 [Xenopus laevis]|uniref:Uncharacterized protein LOC121396834 n=1 Tax=Xenopus laevis TaxID=8355 RepID=A0A8J1LGI6_XENLA|nr:uncharacterized protein LOC121396834 [Xenopus laevis]